MIEYGGCVQPAHCSAGVAVSVARSRFATLLALALTLLMASCQSSVEVCEPGDALCGPDTTPDPVPSSITLSSVTLGFFSLGHTQQLTATVLDQAGGAIADATVTWVSSASVIASVDATGLVTANSVGNATITATSVAASATTQVTVQQAAAAVTVSPASALLTAPGSTVSLTASVTDPGGTAIVDAELTWSSNSEPIATVSATGFVTGLSAGQATLTVSATSGGQTAIAQIPVTVGVVLAIATTALPDGEQNIAYFETLTTTGGTGSNTWSLSTGSLPTGLSLNTSTGEISGTPTVIETQNFTVQVASGSETAQRALSIAVNAAPPLSVVTTSLPDGTQNAPYLRTLTATGGVGGYTWSFPVGSLPTGLGLNTSTGEISGTPTVIETQSFTVQVASGAATAQRALSITVGTIVQAVASIVVTPDPVTLTAVGQTQLFSAVALDANSNPLTVQPTFTWSSTVEATATVVAGTGLATAVANGTTTIEASAAAVTGGASLTVTQAVAAGNSTVEVDQATMVADGVDVTTVTVTARDAQGNPVPGQTVVLAVTGTGNTVTDPLAVTNASGVATGSFTTNIAEAKTVSATAGGVSITQTQFVTATPQLVDAGSSTVAVDQATMLANGTDVTTVTVTALDALGNPVGGQTVTLSVTGLGIPLIVQPPMTDVNGQAEGGFTTTTAGVGTVSAMAGGVLITQTQQVTANVAFTQLAAGRGHTCGLDFTGAAYCWGSNMRGQLGDGGKTDATNPVAVLGGLTFTEITAGGGHTCALDADGTAFCWGWNIQGQLGTATVNDEVTPAAVAGGLTFSRIDADDFHTCAVRADGTAYCWGDNIDGQLGDNSTTDRLSPAAVSGGHVFNRIDAGGVHTCALEGTTAYCWGRNSNGELGNGTMTPSSVPVAVSGGFNIIELAAGDHNVCALVAPNTARCWGNNDSGQLGDGTSTDRTTPVLVQGGHAFTNIGQLERHTCGLEGGAAFCWGLNSNGQLGDGSETTRTSPVAVQGGLSFSDIFGGFGHTCGLDGSGVAYCWGWNDAGQLGDGTNTSSSTPVAVKGS